MKALVYIKNAIPDNGYVKPICLNDRRPERRERCFVAGWGSTDIRSKSYSPAELKKSIDFNSYFLENSKKFHENLSFFFNF